MQQTLKTELLTIMQAVAFSAADAVTFAGRSSPHAAAGLASGLSPTGNPVVTQLQNLFYEHCYCRRFKGEAADTPAARADTPAAQPSGQGLIEAISAANTSREHWDAGWQLMQTLPSGQIVAVKGAMTRMAWPGEFHGHGSPGMQLLPGAGISLFAPRESRTPQPGFYFAFGEALADQQEDYGIVRFYWNVTADGVAPLVGAITPALNHFAIPFRFKCLYLPELFDRSDAAVLYVAKRHYRIVATMLQDVHRAVRPRLKSATPLFSKRLAYGLGLAEDPGTGESFGMSRCRLLAEAACRAHERGLYSAEARLEEAAGAFAATGLSLDRPYLNAGSFDQYEFGERRAA
jgi:hypothetical protein